MTNLRKELQQNVNINNAKFVTLSQFEEVLSNITIIKGMANFATVLQLTEPKTTKKCRDTKEAFLGTVEKLSTVSIILNTDYVRGVENQLERENQGKDKYKKGTNTMPIDKCENNNFFGTFRGAPVLEYRPNTNKNLIPETKYFLNGQVVDKKSLPNVLPTVSSASNQGTEKEIFWRKLYLKNVIELTFNNQTYRLRE